MTSQQTVALLVLSVGAFLAPLFSRRIGVPAAVGEILLGAIIGNVMGPLANTGVPGALGFVGFALLMFTAGTEFDFESIERGGARQMVIGVMYIALSIGLAIMIGVWRGVPMVEGIAFGVTSIGIAVAALREANLLGAPIGQAVLVVGGLGEFISMLALTGIDLVSTKMNRPITLDVLKLVGALLIAYLLLRALRSMVWWYPESFGRLVDAADPSEVGVRAAFALMLAFVAAAALLGIEPILGAFLAGLTFGFVFRSKDVLVGKLSSVGYGFLIPVFFIGVGQDLRLDTLRSPVVLSMAGVALVATVLAKLLPAPCFRLAGVSWRNSVVVSLFLATPLTLQVAVARLGVDLKLLSSDESTALVVASVISGIIVPTLARRFHAYAVTAGEAAKSIR